MADMVHPTHARIRVLSDLRGLYTAPGTAIKIGLYKDALTPTAATPLATFLANECAYPGYARIDAGLSAASDNGSGDGHAYSSLVTFTRGSGGSGDSVGGIMVLMIDISGLPVMVYAYKDFSAPVDMTVAGNSLSRLIELLQGQYPIT